MPEITTFADLLDLHPLAPAVVERLGYDAEDDGQLEECLGVLAAVCRGGADAGFGGFVMHIDTLAFAQANRSAIMAQADQDADDYGIEGGSLALIAGFKYIKESNLSVSQIARAIYDASAPEDDRTVVLNSLAWYALESVAQACER